MVDGLYIGQREQAELGRALPAGQRLRLRSGGQMSAGDTCQLTLSVGGGWKRSVATPTGGPRGPAGRIVGGGQ